MAEENHQLTVLDYDPSQQLITSFPEFKDVRIYGTRDNPLFMAIDVQKMVGIKGELRLERDGYEKDKHYIKSTYNTGDQRREVNVFTERGVYRYLFRHDTDVC